jgi:hypothetical protein
MMGSYNDLTGQGESAWNTASPIYQNLLSEYTKATANPYYYAAPEIEATTADTAKQVQNVYQTLGRGPAQQYAAAQAKLGLGNTAQTAVRNAKNWGYSGDGSTSASSLGQVHSHDLAHVTGEIFFPEITGGFTWCAPTFYYYNRQVFGDTLDHEIPININLYMKLMMNMNQLKIIQLKIIIILIIMN